MQRKVTAYFIIIYLHYNDSWDITLLQRKISVFVYVIYKWLVHKAFNGFHITGYWLVRPNALFKASALGGFMIAVTS